jgi:hypothetical protein
LVGLKYYLIFVENKKIIIMKTKETYTISSEEYKSLLLLKNRVETKLYYEDKANGTTDWAFMINGINDDIKKELIVLKKQKEKRDIIYKELKNKII